MEANIPVRPRVLHSSEKTRRPPGSSQFIANNMPFGGRSVSTVRKEGQTSTSGAAMLWIQSLKLFSLTPIFAASPISRTHTYNPTAQLTQGGQSKFLSGLSFFSGVRNVQLFKLLNKKVSQCLWCKRCWEIWPHFSFPCDLRWETACTPGLHLHTSWTWQSPCENSHPLPAGCQQFLGWDTSLWVKVTSPC